ncbi:unnamed protein product [Ambrosiozyma monospora]|uniref:Unnamed protein product n=1 Tax=Ambrosiozyma monospora TaxID=43982 RepID=A0A9W6W829_AMBMO|nr:unnamed protein product [Ambrosiozyma monospora]
MDNSYLPPMANSPNPMYLENDMASPYMQPGGQFAPQIVPLQQSPYYQYYANSPPPPPPAAHPQDQQFQSYGYPQMVGPPPPQFGQQEIMMPSMPQYSQQQPIQQRSPSTEDRIFKLAQQIEYYFSIENLCKDLFLRKQMDSEGFVDVQIIANFSRVKNMTGGDVELVWDAVLTIEKLETKIIGNEGEQRRVMRLCDGWDKWILPSSSSSSA